MDFDAAFVVKDPVSALATTSVAVTPAEDSASANAGEDAGSKQASDSVLDVACSSNVEGDAVTPSIARPKHIRPYDQSVASSSQIAMIRLDGSATVICLPEKGTNQGNNMELLDERCDRDAQSPGKLLTPTKNKRAVHSLASFPSSSVALANHNSSVTSSSVNNYENAAPSTSKTISQHYTRSVLLPDHQFIDQPSAKLEIIDSNREDCGDGLNLSHSHKCESDNRSCIASSNENCHGSSDTAVVTNTHESFILPSRDVLSDAEMQLAMISVLNDSSSGTDAPQVENCVILNLEDVAIAGSSSVCDDECTISLTDLTSQVASDAQDDADARYRK